MFSGNHRLKTMRTLWGQGQALRKIPLAVTELILPEIYAVKDIRRREGI